MKKLKAKMVKMVGEGTLIATVDIGDSFCTCEWERRRLGRLTFGQG